MPTNPLAEMFFVFVMVTTGFICGACAGNESTNKWWKAETVKRGAAEYNSNTGVWQWKESNNTKEERTEK